MVATASAKPPKEGKRWSLDGDLVGGRYRLDARLGRGGMGEVYTAFDELVQRPVALKKFRLQADRTEDRLRFRREFHTLARLRHPRIVEAYDFGVDDDQPFYTMELLDGRDLGTMAPLHWRDACPLLRDVADALAFLHSRRLLHRDVAPRNVRCTNDGRAKLLDFGMMATMGVSNEIVGTLPSIAPEMILGLPMDQRADLFGLGALAFWLVTGRHPQRVRNLDDLVRNGRKPPPAPSTIVDDIPPAFDDLLLSLLSPEPLGRPASAIEVVERLTAIGGLSPLSEGDAVQGYVRSAELVGREREMEIVRKRLAKAIGGHGSSLLVEGRTGMGKSRLLREIELEAKLAGALVLRGHGDLDGPYALVRRLARELELGTRGGEFGTSGPHGALIDRLVPGAVPEGRKSLDHREERLALQTGLSDFISAFATHRPLLLLVDNLQRADEGSMAVLASLAHIAPSRKLLIVGSVTTPLDTSRTDGALGNLRERALVLRTRALDSVQVARLLRGMFGDAPNLVRLATWIHRAAGGSPMHCTELARHLVERGDIHYLDGMWVIPEDPPAEALPEQFEMAMDTRVSGLGELAHDLACALAVLRRQVGLSTCIELLPDAEESEVFAAIDQLVREEIVIGSAERYHLRHDGLREALLRSLPEPERAALELRVGRYLQSSKRRSPSHDVRIGWHLLRGGERAEGAQRLFAAGTRLFDATSFEDCIAPLEAALEVFRDEDTHPAERVRIMYMLVAAGFYVDRRVNERHRDATIAALARESNVTLARRLSFLPGRLAFVVAFVCGWVMAKLGLGRRFHPMSGLDMYIRSVVYSAGTAGFSFDTETLRACARHLDPLRPLRQIYVANAISMVDNFLNFNLGRQRTLVATSEANIALISVTRPRVTAAERALTIGGARFQRGMHFVRNGSPRAVEEIRELEQLGPRMWAIGALQLRSFYHLWRGETAQARRVWAKAELEFVRLGALWQMHALLHSTGCVAAAVVGDVLGLKRSIAALSHHVEAGLRFEGHLAIAQAEYQRLSGEFEESLASVERALGFMPAGEGLARPWALSARAQTLYDAGRFEDARRVADDAYALCTDPDREQAAFALRSGRVRALARAKLGEMAQARAELDELVAQARQLDNPYFVGDLLEAAALLAVDDDDRPAAARLCDAVEKQFVPTRNPGLVARYEKLTRLCGLAPSPDGPGDAEGDMATEVFEPQTVEHTPTEILSVLSKCGTASTRAARALEALVAAAGAHRGFLYLLRGEDFELAAPDQGAEPPPEVSSSLHQRLELDEAADDDLTTLQLRRNHGWRTVLLHAQPQAGRRIVVAAAVLFRGEQKIRMPPPGLREAIGQRLYDEGDVDTTAGTV